MKKPGLQILRKQDGYIRKEASEITQIRARTIQYYTDRGFVKPDVAAPTGRGTTRRYSRKNLVELSFIRELSAHGYTLEKIEIIMEKVRESLKKYWDKSDDKPCVTDLFLLLKEPSTKDVEVQLLMKEEIRLEELITRSTFRNFSIIGLEGIIWMILEAANGT
jgi:DNA-binding transcriptional MerR regulator